MINKREFTREDYEAALKLLDEIHKEPKEYPEFQIPKWEPPPPDPNACQHPDMPVLEYDSELGRQMDSFEIRKRWPRGNYYCPQCECSVIHYASFEHYIAGDW